MCLLNQMLEYLLSMIWMRGEGCFLSHTLTGIYVSILWNINYSKTPALTSVSLSSCIKNTKAPELFELLWSPEKKPIICLFAPSGLPESSHPLSQLNYAMITVLRLPLLLSVTITPSWRQSALSPSGMNCCCSCLLSDTLCFPLPSLKVPKHKRP